MMGSLATCQFKRADGCRPFQCLREAFEMEIGGFLQVGQCLLLGMTLVGRRDFGTYGHEPVGF